MATKTSKKTTTFDVQIGINGIVLIQIEAENLTQAMEKASALEYSEVFGEDAPALEDGSIFVNGLWGPYPIG